MNANTTEVSGLILLVGGVSKNANFNKKTPKLISSRASNTPTGLSKVAV